MQRGGYPSYDARVQRRDVVAVGASLLLCVVALVASLVWVRSALDGEEVLEPPKATGLAASSPASAWKLHSMRKALLERETPDPEERARLVSDWESDIRE